MGQLGRLTLTESSLMALRCSMFDELEILSWQSVYARKENITKIINIHLIKMK